MGLIKGIGKIVSSVLRWIAILLGIFLVFHTLIRIIRHFFKFPIPEFLAPVIDNPLRRKFQPPDQLVARFGVESDMQVLEVGPGNGRYTLAAARRVGPSGRVVAIDIEPRMIERVTARAAAEVITNVEARLADVYELPFEDNSFDLAYMITVIGEIPDPDRAIRELYRVLKHGGKLAFSEALLDPDYPLRSTLTGRASEAGFQAYQQYGNFVFYTLIFQKS